MVQVWCTKWNKWNNSMRCNLCQGVPVDQKHISLVSLIVSLACFCDNPSSTFSGVLVSLLETVYSAPPSDRQRFITCPLFPFLVLQGHFREYLKSWEKSTVLCSHLVTIPSQTLHAACYLGKWTWWLADYPRLLLQCGNITACLNVHMYSESVQRKAPRHH